MSFLGGIMKSVVNPMTLAQLAMGPAGWASIAAKAVMSAVAQQVIQKVGDQLGFASRGDQPCPAGRRCCCRRRERAKRIWGRGWRVRQTVSSNWSNADKFNFSPSEEGKLSRQADDMVDNLVKQLT